MVAGQAGQVQAVDIRILEARQPLPGPGVTQPVVSRVMAGGGLSSLLSQPRNSETGDTSAESLHI